MRRGRRITANTIANTRLTLARLWRDFYFEKSDMDAQELRVHIDVAKTIIAAHKAEAELRISDEIQEIRTRLKEKNIL